MLALLGMFVMAQTAGAVSYTWSAMVGSSVNTNWSTPGNWSPITGAGGPQAADNVVFGNVNTVTSPSIVNNYVDPGFAGTVAKVVITNSSPSSALIYNVTQIPTGTTLTVTTNFVVGANQTSSGNWTEAYMVGGGTLFVTATNFQVNNADNTTRAGTTAYLNLSGLTNFVYNNPSGAVRVEDLVPGSGDTGLGGNLILAAVSNRLTAANINLGTSTSAQSGAPGSLTLGSGTNIFSTTNLQIASQKSVFTVQGSGSGGGFRVRGISGADSDNYVNISIGNKNVGGGSATITGSLLLNGVAVDIKANTLIVGENSGGTPNSSGDGGIGILQFDTGNIAANSVTLAENTSANYSAAKPATCVGTLSVGAHATLTIGASSLFYLASANNTGPSTGNMIISNGLINCLGPIVMGAPTYTNLIGNITFQSGGELSMGPNSYIGVVSNRISSLTLDTNSFFQVSIPSVSYTNVCVMTNNWPTPDTGMTFSIAAMPAGINPGAVFALLDCTNMTGTFNNPNLILPPGVQGNLSFVANPAGGGTIYLTITAGVGPGTGGVEDLLNSTFGLVPSGTNWTTAGGAAVVSTNSTYPNTGSCTVDTRNIVGFSGPNVAKLTGSFVAGGSTNSWSQSVPVVPGSEFTGGGFTYVAHEDIMSGRDSFYYELDFLNTNGVLLSAYESAVITNLSCGGPNMIPLDTWTLMALTNQMQVTGGINTGVAISNIASAVYLAPPQTATAKFKAVLIQRNGTDTGSVYFSALNLGFLANPVAPTISAITPNLITLCTNTALTCTANSTITSISSVQVVAITNTLNGIPHTVTYTSLSPALTVTGLGTASASISLALATNTIYQSVIVTATDADGLTVSSTAATFDTLSPVLVIEASDFNYAGGNFLDTPANGGLALYANQVGTSGIDELGTWRAATQGYYRPGDAVIMQTAAPGSGTPPSGTEQKFVTSLANGDTTDVEMEVGFNNPGDWVNYSRTFSTNGTGSAAVGTYNVWCYVAGIESGGVLATLSQLTSDPTQPNQTTNFLGSFGGPGYSLVSYNTFTYVPLIDQFGNLATVTVTNGLNTFKSTVVGNPNLGFYMFVPVIPVYTPVFLNVYPKAVFEPTNHLTFTVGPAQGASISSNGIGVFLNGVAVSSGLSFISGAGGVWTVTYPILSNEIYSVTIDVTNSAGYTNSFSTSFNTINLNNFHWMAADYDFSTNNGTSTGGSVGDGWTGGLFINNPTPTGDTNAPSAQLYQLTNSSYFGYPGGFYPPLDPAGYGAVAQQSIDINWISNTNQNPVAGQVANSIYRGGPYTTAASGASDGVGTQVASDSFLLPEFVAARTNLNDPVICEFNIGYFYSPNWLNYTRIYPTGNFNVLGRLASGSAYSGATLSMVTSGVGTSNQTTRVLGTFSNSSAAGYQSYNWVPLLDTNGNNVVVPLGGQATMRLTAPTNATSSGGALNSLFFMLTPATPATSFTISASPNLGNIQISFPTQIGYNYTLWQTTSLAPSSWTPVSAAITGDGAVHMVTEPATGQPNYYKVLAQ